MRSCFKNLPMTVGWKNKQLSLVLKSNILLINQLPTPSPSLSYCHLPFKRGTAQLCRAHSIGKNNFNPPPHLTSVMFFRWRGTAVVSNRIEQAGASITSSPHVLLFLLSQLLWHRDYSIVAVKTLFSFFSSSLS